MNNKPNAVLVTSSNWHTVDSVRTNGRVVKADPKQPYAVIFGKEIRIDRSDVRLFLKEKFQINWK